MHKLKLNLYVSIELIRISHILFGSINSVKLIILRFESYPSKIRQRETFFCRCFLTFSCHAGKLIEKWSITLRRIHSTQQMPLDHRAANLYFNNTKTHTLLAIDWIKTVFIITHLTSCGLLFSHLCLQFLG